MPPLLSCAIFLVKIEGDQSEIHERFFGGETRARARVLGVSRRRRGVARRAADLSPLEPIDVTVSDLRAARLARLDRARRAEEGR